MDKIQAAVSTFALFPCCVRCDGIAMDREDADKNGVPFDELHPRLVALQTSFDLSQWGVEADPDHDLQLMKWTYRRF